MYALDYIEKLYLSKEKRCMPHYISSSVIARDKRRSHRRDFYLRTRESGGSRNLSHREVIHYSMFHLIFCIFKHCIATFYLLENIKNPRFSQSGDS